MISKSVVALATIVLTLFIAARSNADPTIEGSVGYSHLWLSGSGTPFHDRDGARLEVRGVFTPIEDTSNLRFGLALGASGYTHDLPDFTTIDGQFFHHPAQNLSFLQPELQLSWRQYVDHGDHWFFEPGAAIGSMIGHYAINDRRWWNDDHVHNDWSATITGRPFVRGGYTTGPFTFAGEISYAFGGKLNFSDNIHGDVQEFYTGFFFGYRF